MVKSAPDVQPPVAAPTDGIVISRDVAPATVTFSVNALRAPENVYSSDMARFMPEGRDAKLVFAQLDPFSHLPTSAVVIRYSIEDLRKLIDRIAHFYPKLESSVNPGGGAFNHDDGFVAEGISAIAIKSLTERASFEQMAYLDRSAEIDFYYVSPIRLHKERATKSTDGLLRPVVTICLSTEALYSLLRSIKEHVTQAGA